MWPYAYNINGYTPIPGADPYGPGYALPGIHGMQAYYSRLDRANVPTPRVQATAFALPGAGSFSLFGGNQGSPAAAPGMNTSSGPGNYNYTVPSAGMQAQAFRRR